MAGWAAVRERKAQFHARKDGAICMTNPDYSAVGTPNNDVVVVAVAAIQPTIRRRSATATDAALTLPGW